MMTPRLRKFTPAQRKVFLKESHNRNLPGKTAYDVVQKADEAVQRAQSSRKMRSQYRKRTLKHYGRKGNTSRSNFGKVAMVVLGVLAAFAVAGGTAHAFMSKSHAPSSNVPSPSGPTNSSATKKTKYTNAPVLGSKRRNVPAPPPAPASAPASASPLASAPAPRGPRGRAPASPPASTSPSASPPAAAPAPRGPRGRAPGSWMTQFVSGPLYFESQEGTNCAIHAINNLLQLEVVNQQQMDAYAHHFGDETGGMYEIQTIMGILKKKGYSVYSNESVYPRNKPDVYEAAITSGGLIGIIVHERTRGHYTCYRYQHDKWYYLDSLNSGPILKKKGIKAVISSPNNTILYVFSNSKPHFSKIIEKQSGRSDDA